MKKYLLTSLFLIPFSAFSQNLEEHEIFLIDCASTYEILGWPNDDSPIAERMSQGYILTSVLATAVRNDRGYTNSDNYIFEQINIRARRLASQHYSNNGRITQLYLDCNRYLEIYIPRRGNANSLSFTIPRGTPQNSTTRSSLFREFVDDSVFLWLRIG